ncbi:hypothetical protein [Exiguobacterium algae]|uniref:hypothetical protein n=1 Tax=Exiguobacterium algae TaxID=2751250 RepID=UPI001BE72216|nr:hypothetical protein [Exiguobacterium algae]
MMKEWYEGTELQEKIPDFNSTNVKYITDFHYYIGYNSYYDQVSFLEIDFLLEVGNRKFTLKMKFNDVSSLDLLGFGNNYNQLMGFIINNLSESGFEKNKKYLVEDYESNIIKFYCADLEVLTLDETE